LQFGDAAAEAAVFARYLLDRDPPAELISRYVTASGRLFPDAIGAKDHAVLGFIQRYPSALPYLDAAAGLLDNESLVRKKLLLMAAILEASTYYSREFLAGPPGRFQTVFLLGWYVISAGAKAAIGAVLLLLISHGRE
jgi:hypothetical protein